MDGHDLPSATASDARPATAGAATAPRVLFVNHSSRTGGAEFILLANQLGGLWRDVTTIGFRPECTGGWRASAVQDDWDKGSGWRTTVEFEAKEDGSKGGYKDEED